MLAEKELTYKIRGCVFEVYRELGHGFLETVYEKALVKELETCGLSAATQISYDVIYKNSIVGKYFADIVVEEKVILELKAQQNITKASEAQLMNYLAVSGLKVGLLINFSYPKASIKRIVM